MAEPIKLFDAEYRFVSLVWQYEPINSTELAKRCLDQLGWKKSTTYTVLRKLCKRKILANQNSMVTSILKQDEYRAMESLNVVDKTFEGSLPKFLTAFLNRKNLSQRELAELESILREAMK
ncbi:MAG: BlaI/MecI/CopY family transcriptional regulator [Clostridiales bacterium]|nr:BlaI/MecI/CopY family transcriptional regulator [Clostridiales bacterium]